MLTQRHINQVLGKIMDSQIKLSRLKVKLQTKPGHETLLKLLLLLKPPLFNWLGALTAVRVCCVVDHIVSF